MIPALPPVDPSAPGASEASISPAANAKLLAALDGYLNAGGSLLIAGPLRGWEIGPGHLEASNAYLKKWNAEFISELVQDKQNFFKQPYFLQQAYSFTRNIPTSPVSEGVATIWYPADLPGSGGSPSTATMKLGPEWTVVVKGEETAGSYPLTNRAAGAFGDQPNLFKKAPPIAAIREAGKGRLALVAIAPIYTIWGYAHPVWQGVAMTEGDGYRKSDLAVLFDNLYRWLGAPRNGKTVGGYRMTAVEAKGEFPWTRPEVNPIDWTKPIWPPLAAGALMPVTPTNNLPYGPPALGLKHYRGLLGARTALTGGKGNIADYVAEGKKAGLHFIIFAEDLEKLTPESWTQFKQECAASSTNDFLAIPGFEWRNPLGDRSIMGGPVAYPDASMFAPGTRRIVNQTEYWFSVGTPMSLSCSSTNQTPLWNFKTVNAFPVEVWENGKRSEDNFKEYLYDQAREHFYTPVVVNWVKSPQDLAAAVQMAPATILLGSSLKDVMALVQQNLSEAEHMIAYVTAGPQIAAFHGYNLTRATYTTTPVPGTDRWRIRIAAASAKGVREVRIYDGCDVAYQLDGGGKTEFVAEFDGHHDRQHHWVPVVEDVQGRVAIGPVFWTRDLLCTQKMEGDRQNLDPFGIQLDPRGQPQTMFQYSTHQFIKGPMGVFRPGSTSNQEEFHAPGLDASEYSWFWAPTLDLGSTPAEPPMSGWAMRFFTTCSSVEAFIVDMWLDVKYPADAPLKKQFGVYTYDRSVPAEVATASFRYIDAFHPYGRPAPVVCEVALTFLKDVTFPAGVSPWFMQAGRWAPWPGHYDHYTVAADGKTIGGDMLMEGGMGASGTVLKPGDYVALYPSLWGSGTIMAMSDNLTLNVGASKGGLMSTWGFQLPKRAFKAGEALKGTVLFVKGAYPEPANNTLAETIRTTMGFAGKPAYSLEPRIGKIISSLYRIRAEAQDGVWAAVIGKAALPVLLPVEVTGLNDRWEAFRYDRQTKVLRPVPVCEGVAYASVDISAGTDIVIGHPVTSKNPELRLNVFQAGEKWSVTVHNPTDKPIESTLTGSPEFPSVTGLIKAVTVPAKSSVSVPVP